MILFIKYIPAYTGKKELHDFVDSALKTGFIFHFRRGNIVKTEVLSIRDKRTNHVEYHGLVYVDTEKAGLLAIKKLNGKRFKNKVVTVGQYVTRNSKNDRRTAESNVSLEIRERRRTQDRRRNSDQIEVFRDVPDSFKSHNPYSTSRS